MSGGGYDRTILAKRRGGLLEQLWDIEGHEDMGITADAVAAKLGQEAGKTMVDTIGVGHGMPALLKHRHIENVAGVKVSRKAEHPYANQRARLYYKLREQFVKGTISIPNDEQLIEQLADIRTYTRPDGKLIIERKEEIKARTGESPDKADALMLSYADFTGVLEVEQKDDGVEEGDTMTLVQQHNADMAQRMRDLQEEEDMI